MKKSKIKLALNSDTIRHLTTQQLSGVQGGEKKTWPCTSERTDCASLCDACP